MNETPALHSSIVALVALSANIAANHPRQGLCQVEKLKELGVPEAQIDAVIDIARHIRDEAAEQLDAQFDEKRAALGVPKPAPAPKPLNIPIRGDACCTPTPSGRSCC